MPFVSCFSCITWVCQTLNKRDLPTNFATTSDQEKINYIDSVSENILRKYFFDNTNNVFQNLRNIVCNPKHPENYWTSTLRDGRFKCHHCDKSYAHVLSLKRKSMMFKLLNLQKSKKIKPKIKCMITFLCFSNL